MIGDQVHLIHKLKLVAVSQLLAPHGPNFAVDFDLAHLNQGLCLTAGIDDVGKLHGILQHVVLSADGYGNGIVLLFDNNFHK